VVELASPSDEPQALRREMVASIANGSALGWLLLPQFRTVKMWKPGAPETADSPLPFCDPKRLEPSPLFPGQVIDRAGFGEL
jgi:Uma2 family endonuclease